MNPVEQMYRKFVVDKKMIKQIKINSKLCTGCIDNCSGCGNLEQFYDFPDFTSAKVLELEEMVRLKTQGCFEFITNKNPWFRYAANQNGRIIGAASVRQDALASLINKIDWSEEESRQIKEILR